MTLLLGHTENVVFKLSLIFKLNSQVKTMQCFYLINKKKSYLIFLIEEASFLHISVNSFIVNGHTKGVMVIYNTEHTTRRLRSKLKASSLQPHH